jgi:squalene-hopene/tetraprenyl-beta-curcumene cyclase
MTVVLGQESATATEALQRAVGHLRGLQSPEGWWKGELETNVTMDAEDLLLREFLGIRTAAQTEAAARWIRSRQREDGTWGAYFGGPPELSTTVEAYVACRLAGDPPDASHMRLAAEYVNDAGGLERSRVFTRIWLALFGLWPWERLPVLPPELMLLPPQVPLNVYDFACWARQTVVALTVVGAYRPERPLPFGLSELSAGSPPRPSRSVRTWPGRFQLLDDVLHRYERRPLGWLRRVALDRAESWIVARQEADGSWGGIQPPWVYSLMALHLRGYELNHPVMAAGLAGLETFVVEDAEGRRLEACQSPVWDTALAVTALADAGVAPDAPLMRDAATWLLGQEVTTPGDWSVRRPGMAPGGWAFEFENDNYPDVDDSAEVALALRRVDVGDGGAVERAIDWVLGMQCADGGWGAFDVDNTRDLCRQLPFCDFGELIDPPSADVTAHAVELLAACGVARGRMARGVAWLRRSQEADGSWFGRWGANHVYGTGAVVPALVAAGIDPADGAIRRAVTWLLRHQNADGGWGEDLRSYDDPSWRGRGASTASQTAWALLALLAAGERGEPTRRGVRWLVETQRPDGTGDFYINYHLYRLVFPIMALGRYVDPAAGSGSPNGAAERSANGTLGGDPSAQGAQDRVPTARAVPAGAHREGPPATVAWGHQLASVVDADVALDDTARFDSGRLASELEGLLPPAHPVVIVTQDPSRGTGPAAGRVLVASELRLAARAAGLGRRRTLKGSGSLIAAELRRAGLEAEEGALVVSPRSDHPGGSDGVPPQGQDDPGNWMALLAALGERPAVVVQVGGADAAAAAGPVLRRWARALGGRHVHLAAPRSFCAGVERAIETVERALERFGPPVFVRRQIVHNSHVVRDLSDRGAVFVEELDEVPEGSIAVLAAHGVAPTVRAEADGRADMTVIDATCPLVAKVHHEARRYAAHGQRIVLIGHAGHEEVIGTMGEAPEHIVLVESVSDVDGLELDPGEPLAYLTQTTLSVDETAAIVGRLKDRYPQLEGPSTEDICYATQNRQDAVRAIAGRCDLMLVIGSANSSNTLRLVEASRLLGCEAHLIEDESEMRLEWLEGTATVGITAGASAPDSLVHRVVEALRQLGRVDVTEHQTTEEDVRFALPRQVR